MQSIKPAIYDFDHYKGADLRKTWTWRRAGTPVALAGYTGDCQFRATIEQETPLVSLTSASGGVLLGIAGPTEGQVTLYVPKNTLASLPSEVKYAVRLNDPVSGDAFFLVMGTIKFLMAATR